MKKNHWIIISCLAVVLLIALTQISIFVIQPIGALPEGKTLVILRLNKSKFIDSPDAMCERINGGVNLLCRAMVMGAVVKKSKILMRLPYSESLYLMSTGGKTYSK